ncbi:MAG: cobalamin B12-binding domain-containing protein [Rhodobacteraceae bacterium]|nr:cobalamin B12-binding domain-containing protein [Paracoccaceae bacterium]
MSNDPSGPDAFRPHQPAVEAADSRPVPGPDPVALAREHARLERVTKRLPRPTVELLVREVLVRLGRRSVPLPRAGGSQPTAPAPDATERLARLLVGDDHALAMQHVFQLFEDGATMGEVYLDHLAPAARLMGDWWGADTLPFADVTIGTGRIYGIMRHIRTHMILPPKEQTRAAIFVTVPGEVHTLGITMAADLFRERGWTVRLLLGQRHTQLVREMAQDRSPVIGLSASGRQSVEPLARLIVALRMARPTAHIMVGGAVTVRTGARLRLTDPDSTIIDMAGAADLLNGLEARFPAR